MPEEPAKQKMGIRERITLFFLVLIFVILFPALLLSRFWFSSVTASLEKQLLKQTHQSLGFFFDTKGNYLKDLTQTFSRDPDVLKRLSGQQGGFLDFPPASLVKETGLDFILIFSADRKIAGGHIDLKRLSGDKDFSVGAWEKEEKFNQPLAGFWHGLDSQLWLIAFSPVMTGRGQRIGSIACGILIDDELTRELSLKLGASIQFFHSHEFFSSTESNVTDEQGILKDSWQELLYTQQPFLIQREEKQPGIGSFYLDSLLRDCNGDAFGIVRIKNPLAGFGWPNKFVWVFLWLTFVVSAFAVFFLIRFFTQHIVSPLVKMRAAMREIASSGYLSKRLRASSQDEIGGLISEFNNMLDELEKMNKKVKSSSEQMAVLYKDLLEQKKFTSEVFATAPGILLVLSPDGTIKSTNQPIERFTGYTSEETIGKDWFEHFLSFDKRQQVRAMFDDIVNGNLEPHRQKEYEILTKDGKERLILWNHSVLKDKNGRLTAVIALGQDITDLKKIENELVKKMNDLERFFKVTMDREKVVIHLKDQIKELKEKLEGTG